ncbi:MAG: GNAT family N-acetyltransferase, partial [Chitinophagaceae bacterium]|nr:GNAT family N-acetyltransferase [Chitinophagaceae bacterium]
TYINGNEASTVMFPSLTKDDVHDELDVMMESFRQHPPRMAGYWSLLPAKPDNAGLYLLARGWQTGWHPCWMALDTQNKSFDHSFPEGYRITEDNQTIVSNVGDLPYAEDSAYISSALLRKYPEESRRIIAWYNEEVIGHCCLFFSEGKNRVAGLYNMGVVPEQRGKDIGKALLTVAAEVARQNGFRYVTLNANHMGRPLYEKVGFELIGYGITWWLMNKNYIKQTSQEVQLAEAVGTGDIKTLERLASASSSELLGKPMSNGMRWIEFAIYFNQQHLADWLVDNGALLTAYDAWILGWKEKASALLQYDPQEINRRYFDWGGTLLHIAADKNDHALLIFALQYNPDLSIKDYHHNGTPLDWAMFFKREEMISSLKKAIDGAL